MTQDYADPEPTAAAVAATPGTLLLEFGVPWCPHCQAAQPALADALADVPGVTHWKIEDGKGRPLGRAFGVKLWPTLVVLRDGTEVARVVRPRVAEPIRKALSHATA